MKRITTPLAVLALAGGITLAQGAGETNTLQTWVNTINTWMVSAKVSITALTSKDATQDARLAAAEAANAALLAVNNAQDKRITAVEGVQATQAADIAALKALVAPPPPPPPPPPPLPPTPVTILWSAGMETGNLGEWAVQNNNTGSALSSAVKTATEGVPARTTPWVMKQAVTVNGAATRMGAVSIVPQVKAGTPFWVTWWDYYPAPIKFGPADQYAILQIAGFDGANYNPVWAFYLNGVDGTPVIIWSPNDKAPAGPHAGESGKRTYVTQTPVPIGKWTLFELYVDPSENFLGTLQLYMDRALLFDQSSIKTRYPGTGDPGLPGYMYLEHLAYGSPGVHYVDDVTYSLGRMP